MANCPGNIGALQSGGAGERLPTHLAHPFQNESAIVIQVIEPPLVSYSR
jgi:hypothetical protein